MSKGLLKCLVLVVAPAVFLLGACSGVSYVDNAELRTSSFANNFHKGEIGNMPGRPKQFGAFILSDPKATKDSTKGERLFILKKSGKKYMAETLLTDNSDKKKAAFKKSYFSFGTNRKNKSIGIEFRFTY